MGSIIRLLIGIPAAVIVVGALFLVMWGLIADADVEIEDERDPVNISIGQRLQDTDVVDTRKFERPQLEEVPPPPPAIDRANFEPTVEGVQAAPPSFETGVEIGSAFNPDRDAQPLVRVPPEYPQRCASRHRERETVSLRFDVNPSGQVTNVQVTNSTNSCFDRSATRSAERWKYQPKIEEGDAAWRRGVQTNIQFDPPPE